MTWVLSPSFFTVATRFSFLPVLLEIRTAELFEILVGQAEAFAQESVEAAEPLVNGLPEREQIRCFRAEHPVYRFVVRAAAGDLARS